MDSLQAHSAGSLSDIGEHGMLDDEIPLGWECADPALQIERWLDDAAPLPERR
jgi:hypothetical protein